MTITNFEKKELLEKELRKQQIKTRIIQALVFLAYFWNDLDENTHNAITAIDGSLEIYDKNGNLLTRDY